MKRPKVFERNSQRKINDVPVSRGPIGVPRRGDTRAVEDFENHITELFSAGKNTMQIAELVKAPESKIYNILARLGA